MKVYSPAVLEDYVAARTKARYIMRESDREPM